MELHRRVEQISVLLAELRQAAGDGPKRRELIDSLFRTVHTFKAAAAAEGFTRASGLAHGLENLLHDVRTGKTKLDEDVLRVFEDTTAALLSESDVSPVAPLTSVASDGSSTTDRLPAEFAHLKEEERHRALSAIQEGSKLYTMEVAFAVSDFNERFRQLKERLEKIAELISTSASVEDDKVIFRVIYASRSEKIRVQTIFRQAVLSGQAVAAKLGKQVNFVLEADELLLNKSSSDVLADALLHLVRNAVDHGVEKRGNIVLEAKTDSDQTQLTVTDDGRGIAPENLERIFQPGFSTTNNVTEFSGRGVGLDAVKTAIESFGGSVSVTSETGKGSSFKITLPNPS